MIIITGKVCTVGGCFRKHRRHGFCDLHWQRALPTAYNAVHKRLARKRGRAADHRCLCCGAQAHTWSYNHGDDQELISQYGFPYSTDLNSYIPLCRLCHRRIDLAVRGAA